VARDKRPEGLSHVGTARTRGGSDRRNAAVGTGTGRCGRPPCAWVGKRGPRDEGIGVGAREEQEGVRRRGSSGGHSRRQQRLPESGARVVTEPEPDGRTGKIL
jgi:hypothetical protein